MMLFKVLFFIDQHFISNFHSPNSNDTKTIVPDAVNNTFFFEKQKGKRKVLGLVKTNVVKDNRASIFVADLLNTIAIASLNRSKISFVSIFVKIFPPVHNNPLFTSKKLKTEPLKSDVGNDDKFQFLSTVNASMSQ